MGNLLSSVDQQVNNANAQGGIHRFLVDHIAATTAATVNSGKVSVQRLPSHAGWAVPSVGGSVTGVWLDIDATSNPWVAQTQVLIGIEYLLGTLTVSGNSYVDGVAMPSKLIRGTTSQTCADHVFAVVTTALTATTPVLTIRYTNQAGTTGQTATLTLPTSPAVNTAFLVDPHLASGDVGIQDLSASAPNGLSISTGSAGVIKLYGLLVLSVTLGNTNGITIPSLVSPQVPWLAAAGDTISAYRIGSAAAADLVYEIHGYADV